VKRPFVIGLTGSIAMGKSETARMFAAEGVPVHDADAVIHKLYGKGGGAVEDIANAFPGTLKDGAVDRVALSNLVAGNAAALKRLEALVHPLVTKDRDDFLATHQGAQIVVLDIPLLLETEADEDIDALVVVSASGSVQRERALARPGMSVEKFEALKARQISDAQKRQQAQYVVMTDKGLDHARGQVKMILAEIRTKLK
jgi:dephospho-CoA kinase